MRKPVYYVNTFQHFRKTWSPRASYHLTRMRHGEDWKERLVSAIWLAANRIPSNGVPHEDHR